MSLDRVNTAVRRGAALFDMTQRRGLIEVTGEDRVRWLDGMISGDVERLEASGPGAGCYATLLTNRGAIVADLHVARLGEGFLLESARSEIPRILETLERFIIADDVILSDRSALHVVLGLEGRVAGEVLAAAIGDGEAPARESWREARIGDVVALVGAFGWTGEPAYQLRIAPGDRESVEAALDGTSQGPLERGDADDLEVLRVEAGVPALGSELDEEVLPPEARLEHAIAPHKGCYVGQEIVARLRARGQVNHLLVGLALDATATPAVGADLVVGERRTGELTSVVESPVVGPIALGFVRREHAEPGTVVHFEGGAGRVVPLPFVPVGGGARGDGGGDEVGETEPA